MPTDVEREFDRRLEQAKLDALKELAYGASHEINNPLANISARAQTLLRDETHPERRRALEAIVQQALRAHEMIADLMLFARPPRLVREAVDLRALVEELLGEAADECKRRQIVLRASIEVDRPVPADETQLAVALGALVTNSIEAIGKGGRIDVLASDEGDVVRIRLSDDGPGIPAEARPHIFDPFFSGREAGRGLGFGLSKAWRIVKEHGGRLEVDDSVASGAAFVIDLPAAAGDGEPGAGGGE